mmetsp:Transcript_19002/g.40075  ORF Transcript_19002/g.40075 Transcript_19002/m.40075 type:complete len:374 (+) Transcript_19002:87-1208(+)
MLRAKAKEKASAALRERLDERLGRSSPSAADRDVASDEAPPNDAEFDRQAEEAIPAEVRMISGCHDEQTSADVGNVATFQLPDPAGMAGGACTSAILQVIYKEEQPSCENLTFMDVFLQTREVIKSNGFEQIPQLSSSRCIDVNQPFDLMTNKYGNEGTRYAVLIGINYTSHRRGRLRGCHNDVHNICKYIMDVGNVEESNITILLDDGTSTPPTRENIMQALDELTQKCQPGDTAFVHYSGHGGRVKDETGEDPTGFNSTLVPLDFNKRGVGHILDKELYEHLVCAMPSGTSLTCLMDCCHSGTVLDLPYNFVADGEQTEMTPVKDFPFVKLIMLRQALREAGVERLMDLRDSDKREQVKAAMAEKLEAWQG